MKKVAVLIFSLLLSGCASENSATNFSGNDLMFAAMMVPHHAQAIEMADLAISNSSNPEIVALANEIKEAQDPEIAEMKSWGELDLGAHMGHVMDGMLTEVEMSELKTASGQAFDELFLIGMIKHHEGAIEMAEMVIDSSNLRAANLGKAIIRAQQAEIKRMRELLRK